MDTMVNDFFMLSSGRKSLWAFLSLTRRDRFLYLMAHIYFKKEKGRWLWENTRRSNGKKKLTAGESVGKND